MIFNSTMQTALNKLAISPRWFIWVKAKNRTTGAIEASGLWSGISDYTTIIDGETRTYRGAGGLIAISEVGYSSGYQIAPHGFTVSLIDPSIVQMIRVYDVRLAEADLHLGIFDPETESFIGMTRAFIGYVDKLNIKDDNEASIELVSSMRNGTKPLYTKQSDAAQRQRDASDTGLLYSSVSNSVKVFWGQKSAYASGGSGGSPNGVDPLSGWLKPRDQERRGYRD